MNYREAKEYIENVERMGVELGLERMRALLDLLSSPDEKLKFVHVAGTNGKGSVCAYLTSVLKCAGYKVGTYNSPSVFDYNERFLLDGKPFDDDTVARLLTKVRDTIKEERLRIKKSGISGSFTPTAFEIETAVAVSGFYEAGCDICVLEAGLGGRWDATNAVREKVLAVITPIGLDHCDILGNTLGEIAAEKAAIIRDDAVTVNQCSEIMRELRRPYVTSENGKRYIDARLYTADVPVLLKDDINGQTFSLSGREYEIKLLGAYQRENAALAVKAAEILRKRGFKISDDAIRKGLFDTVWEARFEIVKNAEARFDISVPQGKTLIFDGTHNPHGAKSLKNSIKEYFGGKTVCFVTGVLKDKDYGGILKELMPLASELVCVTPPSPRGLDKEILARAAYALNEKGIDIKASDGVREAVQNALDGECPVIVLCGSLKLFEGLSVKRR